MILPQGSHDGGTCQLLRAASYNTMPYHIVPYHSIPHHTIPYHTAPSLAVPYHTVPCHSIPYYTLLPRSAAQAGAGAIQEDLEEIRLPDADLLDASDATSNASTCGYQTAMRALERLVLREGIQKAASLPTMEEAS